MWEHLFWHFLFLLNHFTLICRGAQRNAVSFSFIQLHTQWCGKLLWPFNVSQSITRSYALELVLILDNESLASAFFAPSHHLLWVKQLATLPYIHTTIPRGVCMWSISPFLTLFCLYIHAVHLFTAEKKAGKTERDSHKL